jgi:hypothetical protein
MSQKGKGGSYPHYQSHQKYELPIGYAPLGPPSDAYRDGWERIFAPEPPTTEQERSESDETTEQPRCPDCGGEH